MNIEAITLSGFRCFGHAPQTVKLSDFTCFIGPNASGKTSCMLALARLFGESGSLRQIQPSDFHLAHDENLTDKPERSLFIEAKIVFAELVDGGGATSAIPEVFNQMIVEEPEGVPYCRVRLEATWHDSGTTTGDAEQSTSWILTSSDDFDTVDQSKRPFKSRDRSLIHLVYIPANRNPNDQIRNASVGRFGRLIQNIELSGQKAELEGHLSALRAGIGELAGVKSINQQIQKAWKSLYSGHVAKDVGFRAVDTEANAVIQLLAPYFMPGEDGRAMTTHDLSDGLRSLFSISLTLGFFRLESLLRSDAEGCGFKSSVTEGLPHLSVFAVEEPENHLSPQYLGAVISEMRALSGEAGVQMLVSSHSPCILARVEPENIRYFLGHEGRSESEVLELSLPEDKSDESYKYVREAVRGHPELYFAKLVILGEGPSEEIVLKRLFEANGMSLDGSFTTVAPLGGRHVNHFWRLLNGLKIPYITLLDLDREKEGAGWGRIQYVRDQLVALYEASPEKLQFHADGGAVESLSNSSYDVLDRNDPKMDMGPWLEFYLKQHGVFFSQPLDLDFSLLENFTLNYQEQAPSGGGPRLPDKIVEPAEYNAAIIRRMKQVLTADAEKAADTCGETYSEEQKALFTWYKYLFVDGSKPVSHMRAMIKLTDQELKDDAPEILKQLIEKAKELTSIA
ncbi:AAA family ATPase [Coraliomargarita sp. SDUM461004]|uniref:AAA family ATPase n=1 Tax=Thalassobacterium sedimentorum TaxID=3041258 RepID=A0ABU1AGS6_9BACT|nr:AAA family ATPase [Coraliomargarita sp. SDUM461004]MDQ8194036.1 AAA family ATPase [Coraliomargarita sp. SDUM461004]